MDPGPGTVRHALSEESNRCATGGRVGAITPPATRLSLPRYDDDISSSGDTIWGSSALDLPALRARDLRLDGAVLEGAAGSPRRVPEPADAS